MFHTQQLRTPPQSQGFSAVGEVVVVGALPGLSADDQRVLVRRLLEEGVVVPA
jgi:hypothetical protein